MSIPYGYCKQCPYCAGDRCNIYRQFLKSQTELQTIPHDNYDSKWWPFESREEAIKVMLGEN